MQVFTRKTRPTVPADAATDAPRTIPHDWLAEVAGGLNPQPLPPHVPEHI
jgi:hypothetical protein